MGVFSRIINLVKGHKESSEKGYYQKSWQSGKSQRRKERGKPLAPLLSAALSLLFLLIIAYFHMDSMPSIAPDVHDKTSLGESLSSKSNPFSSKAEIRVESFSSSGEDTLITSNKESEKLIPVYVSGAVKKPGVYYLKEGALLLELLDLAGGLSAEAAANKLNLAAELCPNSHIHFPSKDEQEEGCQEEIPALNQLKPPPDQSNLLVEGKALLDLNTCTRKELMQIKGIGEVLAEAIIGYRQSLDRPMSKEDLRQVKGIAEKKYSALAPYFK